MYSLISGLVHHLLEKPRFNVLILGLDGAGKTTVLNRVKGASDADAARTLPTVGLNLARVSSRAVVSHVSGAVCTSAEDSLAAQSPVPPAEVTAWDLGGQTGLRELWSKYFEDADALVFVIDWSDTDRIDEARRELIAALDGTDPARGSTHVSAARKAEVTGTGAAVHGSLSSLSSSSSSSSSSTTTISPSAESSASLPAAPSLAEGEGADCGGDGDDLRKNFTQAGRTYATDGARLSPDAPLFVCANKMDLRAEDAEAIASRLDLSAIVGARPWLLLPTSAKTGEGLARGFLWLFARVAEKHDAERARGERH